jgi:hypothetical protein
VFKYDISFLKSYKPDIVVLEIGTNNLSNLSPEVVGSRIDDHVRYMLDELNIKVIAVCQVINRHIPMHRTMLLIQKLLFCGSICLSFWRMNLAYFFGTIVNLTMVELICCLLMGFTAILKDSISYTGVIEEQF